ncbi:MAG: response regulator [Ferruginibacter sp.]
MANLNILILLFLFTWWFKLVLVIVATLVAVIFHYRRIGTMKNKQSDLERQLAERNELLLYAGKSEQKASDKAMLAERNKGLLLTRINHELRTPMNGVLGMAGLLNQTDLTSEQQEYVDGIVYSGDKLMIVIKEIMMNDILEYSKIESGKELEAKDIDLSNCIEEVLDVFGAKAATAGVDLLYYIDENVPRHVVGDLRRLRQIITNLVENSIRFTNKGEIYIGVRLITCNEDNRIKLEFEVRDTGIGMTADQTSSLTKSLNMHSALESTEKNTGAGLLICKKLVALMGGSILVESTEQEGTTVKFTIYSRAGMQPSQTQINAEINELAGKRILIADDNALVRNILCRQLEYLKMETTSTANGKEALDLLSQVSFDLVITDLLMPEMDGIELAQGIREKYPALPVILLNPVNDERLTGQAELFGAVLAKPVKRLMLLDSILTQLRSKDTPGNKKKKAIHKLSDQFSIEYPLNILIAEDNPLNQQWTIKILSKLGYKAELANNGKEVLELVSTRQYDLILMDVQMPEMDGMEATRMIRLCLEAQPIIIAMTANVLQGDRQDCMQSGMNDYISKPVELNELVGMLEKWALLIKQKKQSPLLTKR